MKYVNCPTCEWTLGVPGKLLGQAVSCPKCESEFLAQEEHATDEKPTKKKRNKNRLRSPSSSSLPAPQLTTRTSGPNRGSSPSDFEPPKRENHNQLRSPRRDADDEVSTESSGRGLTKGSTETKNQVTARIIQAETEPEDFVKDGELPTLQLKDDEKKKDDQGELRSRPIFLGLVICASVLSSGLMLFFADFSPKVDESVLNKARDKIRMFYSVRPDVELKPYQLELREAQLAHSRNDRAGEIAAYRKVMNRFRAEDKNKFVGVTGSPIADEELEELVSTLLGDGKNESKR